MAKRENVIRVTDAEKDLVEFFRQNFGQLMTVKSAVKDSLFKTRELYAYMTTKGGSDVFKDEIEAMEDLVSVLNRLWRES